MASTPDEVRETLSLIEGARLPHPLGLLLSTFVKEAMNPLMSSRYVQKKHQEGALRDVASNWIYIVKCSEYMFAFFQIHS